MKKNVALTYPKREKKCRSWRDPWGKSLPSANLFSSSGQEGKGLQSRALGGRGSESLRDSSVRKSRCRVLISRIKALKGSEARPKSWAHASGPG